MTNDLPVQKRGTQLYLRLNGWWLQLWSDRLTIPSLSLSLSLSIDTVASKTQSFLKSFPTLTETRIHSTTNQTEKLKSKQQFSHYCNFPLSFSFEVIFNEAHVCVRYLRPHTYASICVLTFLFHFILLSFPPFAKGGNCITCYSFLCWMQTAQKRQKINDWTW